MKFQFQFAGADFNRPSSPYRKWARYGMILLVSALALLAYWRYLYHLTHRPMPVVAHVSTVATKPVAPVAVKQATPAASTSVSSLNKLASQAIDIVSGSIMEAAKIVRVAPATPIVASAKPISSEPAAKPVAVAMAAPASAAQPKPVAAQPVRVRTEQDRMTMAANTAFANVIDLAGSNPDAYGFQLGDFLSDAKLGAPIPVYIIEESVRANYQSGQPVQPLLKPARRWVFPIMMGNRVCCMVEVKQVGRDYVPGKGSKSLAMAWDKIQEKWPAADGFHPALLVNPNIPGYYFTVPELPMPNITDTIQMFYLHPDTSPADVILASWR